MNLADQNRIEFEQAIARSLSFQLIKSPPRICAPLRLAGELLRSELGTACISMAPGRSTGFCQIIASSCFEYIKDRLDCDAWIVFGWLSDYSRPGSFFWRMNADDLCRGLTKGGMGVAEFHAWIMLDSGETIDPVVYPTLAENFQKFARGAGRCHFLRPEGRPYKVIPGLPLLQYHPQAFVS